MREWDDLLTETERRTLRLTRLGKRAGLGETPALLVVDAQNYIVGSPVGASEEYPSACGLAAKRALTRLQRVLRAARQADIPVIYTQLQLRPDVADAGVYALKRDIPIVDGWLIEGTTGAQISELVRPAPSDVIITKKKPSAFFGTHLLSTLIDRGVDSLIVAGGTTSNCVRATVIDGFSYNYRIAVLRDCVFDRFEISHRVTLFDLDRQYADVITSADAIHHLARRTTAP